MASIHVGRELMVVLFLATSLALGPAVGRTLVQTMPLLPTTEFPSKHHSGPTFSPNFGQTSGRDGKAVISLLPVSRPRYRCSIYLNQRMRGHGQTPGFQPLPGAVGRSE